MVHHIDALEVIAVVAGGCHGRVATVVLALYLADRLVPSGQHGVNHVEITLIGALWLIVTTSHHRNQHYGNSQIFDVLHNSYHFLLLLLAKLITKPTPPKAIKQV